MQVFHVQLTQKIHSVRGPGQKFFNQVLSGQPPLGLENFPLKSQIFPSDQKNIIRLGKKIPRLMKGRPLIYCGSKVYSGRLFFDKKNIGIYYIDRELVRCFSCQDFAILRLIHFWTKP